VQRIGYRHQRTLARSAEVRGVGFITGARSRLRFYPAPADTGLVFIRADLPGRPTTAACPDHVTGTARRTTLGPAETGVTLVEHVLAALAGLRIDNCLIELDAAEPPGLDGSAWGFVEAITGAGAVLQSARREIRAVTEPVIVHHARATIALHPPSPEDGLGLRSSYILDYGPRAAIARQAYSTLVTPENFKREIAGCRTFLLESEAHALRQQGIGTHLRADQLLVFGPRGPIDNTLRYADEPARHKVLDLLGDLALCGFDVAGHLVAYRSGHALNVHLAQSLAARLESPRLATTPPASPWSPVNCQRRAA
jgi:UDP-3-O-acyl N-acetylglucosamine deacetylase